MRNKINISYQCFDIKAPLMAGHIRKCIAAALAAEQVCAACEINVMITDDVGIHGVNLASRNIDKPTDVLSFPMFQFEPGNPPTDWTEYEGPETGLVPLGDKGISLQRAASQAQEFGHSGKREVGYLTIHSMLHLLGYDHLDEGPMKAQMRSREEAIAATITGMQRD